MESLNAYIVFMREAVWPSFLLIFVLWIVLSAVCLLVNRSRKLSRRRSSGVSHRKYGLFRTELLIFSVATVLGLTVFGREVHPESQCFNLVPFWTYPAVWNNNDGALAIQIVLNVLLFVPFGFSLPMCYESCRSMRKVLAVSALFSGMIELIQGIFAIGLCEFDDVFHNTLGALIGYGLFLLCRKFYEAAFGKR